MMATETQLRSVPGLRIPWPPRRVEIPTPAPTPPVHIPRPPRPREEEDLEKLRRRLREIETELRTLRRRIAELEAERREILRKLARPLRRPTPRRVVVPLPRVYPRYRPPSKIYRALRITY